MNSVRAENPTHRRQLRLHSSITENVYSILDVQTSLTSPCMNLILPFLMQSLKGNREILFLDWVISGVPYSCKCQDIQSERSYDIIQFNPITKPGVPSEKRICPSRSKSPESSPVLLGHSWAPF